MFTVLAASSSEFRREWYHRHLSRENFAVQVVDNALECVAQLQREAPDILILETPLLWGGADGVLDVIALEQRLGKMRVLLVAVRNEAGEMYRVARHPVDDVLSRAELEGRLVDRVHRLVNGDCLYAASRTGEV